MAQWETGWWNSSVKNTFQAHVPSSSNWIFLLLLLGHREQPKADAAGFRRCRGTCPSCRRCRPLPPSIRPCRRARFLQRLGRLSSQTTVLGSCPDGRLKRRGDCYLLPLFREESFQGPVVGARTPEWTKILVNCSRSTFLKIKLNKTKWIITTL